MPMRPMTAFDFGDTILVPFPFTDQTGTKRRPAVVVSSPRYHRERPDLILMPITSQNPGSTRFGDVPVSDIAAAGLLTEGTIKPVLLTLECRLAIKRLGRICEHDQARLRYAVAQLFG